MKSSIFSIFIFLTLASCFSQNTDKNIYSGGMLIFQPGYVFAENGHQKIENANFGIGGILRLYIFDFLTAGIYGGSQKTNYNSVGSKNSYFNISYGGPFVGITKKTEKFRYTISAFVGFGAIKNLHIENQNNNTLTDASLYKESAMIFSPILSIDYALSKKLYLTMQAVCLTANTENLNSIYNPVFQLGILFSR